MPVFPVRKNSPGMKKCAFCRHFYDPMSEAVSPKRGQKDTWEYRTHIRKPCRVKANREVESQAVCPKFESRL